MKKAFVTFLLFFSMGLIFSIEYFVGKDLSDFCLLQVNENDPLVVYEQNDSIKGFLKTEMQIEEKDISFVSNVSNVQGLKTYDYSVPIVCFLGNYGEYFGLFLVEFFNNSFSDVLFVPVGENFVGNVEKIQIHNQNNWINYSFILDGTLYCVQWSVRDSKLEKLFKFDFSERVDDYQMLVEEDSIYGYAISSEDDMFLFSCIDGYIFSEKQGKLLSKDVFLSMSFLGNKYCTYICGSEKSIVKYENKNFNKIISLNETDVLPLLLYDNLDTTKKISVVDDKITLNDRYQTQTSYDFLEIIPIQDKVLLLIKNSHGWKILETNFSETEEYFIDINGSSEFLQFHLSDEYNLVFHDKENSQIVFYDLINKKKNNFYTLVDCEKNVQKRDVISLFLLTLKVENFDIVFLENGNQIRTEEYLLIKYTEKRNGKYCYALYNNDGYIQIIEFTE